MKHESRDFIRTSLGYSDLLLPNLKVFVKGNNLDFSCEPPQSFDCHIPCYLFANFFDFLNARYKPISFYAANMFGPTWGLGRKAIMSPTTDWSQWSSTINFTTDSTKVVSSVGSYVKQTSFILSSSRIFLRFRSTSSRSSSASSCWMLKFSPTSVSSRKYKSNTGTSSKNSSSFSISCEMMMILRSSLTL